MTQFLANTPLIKRTGWQHWQPVSFVLLALVAGVLLARLPLAQAALLVGISAVVLLTFIQPLVGLAVTLVLGPLGALESVLLGGSILDSGQIMLLLTLALWAAGNLMRREFVLRRTFLMLPLLIWLAIAALSVVDAPDFIYSARELLKWVEIGLLMWLIVDVGSRGNRQRTIWALVGMLLFAGTVQALVGIWQFGLRGDGPEHFLVLGQFYRAYGTFEQPNPFGGYINLSLLLAVGVTLGLISAEFREWRQTGTLRWSWLLGVMVAGSVSAVAAMALIFSWSRGAWLGMAAGLATVVFFWPRKLWWGLCVIGIGVTLLGVGLWLDLVPQAAVDRLAGFTEDFTFGDVRGVDINDENYSVLERLAHWQAAYDMAREQLWLGVGFGNYEPTYADHALLNWPDPLGHAHNYYVNLLAEVGVLGLLAYGLFWISAVWQTIRVLRRADWPRRGIGMGLLGAFVALSVHHLVDKLYVNNIYVHLGVMFGLLQLLDVSARGQKIR